MDSRARRCAHCSAALKTLRCAGCFQINPPEAICCSGCGRELGLSPLSTESGKSCPHCAVPLSALTGERGLLLDCNQCGGQFVEHTLLYDLLERREKLGKLVPRRPARQRLELTDVRYVGCPECKQVMNRKNFGGTSGIVVDVCHRHGTWFDSAELAGVLAFVETGGAAQPPLRAGQLEGAAVLSATPPAADPGSVVGDVAGEAAVEIGLEAAFDVAGDLLGYVITLISD